ncbi:MAG: aldo/keto reductase, partial [Clostridiales bacterium]|nr:aldo/keto reductase [Clostridiales bacterium]
MEYRKLPKGNEQIGVLGIGLGGIQDAPSAEIEAVVRKAIDNGINYFDACGGGASIYEPFGKAIAGQREKVFFQLHFGAVYNEKGEYGWSRDLNRIKQTLDWELKLLGTDYIDFGFLHCIDEDEDFDEIKSNGIFDYVLSLKNSGVIRHIGFSSHTPSVADRVLDEGVFDMMMFSINPAYDLEQGDEYGKG